ncbi:hypothetical protein [Staphylococcus gallinarum]|uniref:hypothetical protein n=1 Tax=Staphylococcus gallinarum TaxID=1293 RepID=UPI001304B21D|nr:hypothetical protein [Staphylococcus gallinarum]
MCYLFEFIVNKYLFSTCILIIKEINPIKNIIIVEVVKVLFTVDSLLVDEDTVI